MRKILTSTEHGIMPRIDDALINMWEHSYPIDLTLEQIKKEQERILSNEEMEMKEARRAWYREDIELKARFAN